MTKENKTPKKILPFIWQMTNGYRTLFFVTFFISIFNNATFSAIPYIYKIVIDGITQSPASQIFPFVAFWCAVYVSALFLGTASSRLSTFFGMRAISYIANRNTFPYIRNYLQKHSHRFYADNFAGSLNAKEVQIGQGVRNILAEILWSSNGSIIGLLMVTGLISSVDVRAGVIFVVLVGVIILINIPLFKWQGIYAKDHAKAAAKTKGLGMDVLTNMRAVLSFVQSGAELARYEKVLQSESDKNVKKFDITQVIFIINALVILFAISCILWMLLLGYKNGTVTPGDFVLVFALLSGVWTELLRIGSNMNNISNIYSEAREAMDVIFAEHDVKDKENAPELVAKNGKIVLENMSFSHDAVEVFKDFNLHIKAGERVGLVGKSGAGKSTLVSLLLREYDIASGAIKIDGTNIAEVTQDSLRRAISVVPQEPALFHRSIKENIAYARPDATDEEIRVAAQKAHAIEFIDTLPEGMNTLVGERGVKLSGGQRQRIAIARAILKDAPILILDEATSALDSESELAVQKALKELMYGKTVIAIAHRLSTLRDMSRILLLEHGTVKEDGTHEELIKKEGTYATLWNHQAGGFLQEE